MIKVLVFPCGSEIGLEVYRSLSYQKDIKLYGASSVEDHGSFVYKNYIGNVPNIYDTNFADVIKNIILEYQIDYIYPCMDIVLHKLKQFESYIRCPVLTSAFETTDICSSKLKTYNFLKNVIRTPHIYYNYDNLNYPVFSKPAVGSSSRNTFIISSADELNLNIKKYPENLILEYLPGEEYTVDCFTTKNRELKFIGSRKRDRISNGISVNTYCVKDSKIEEIANTLNSSLLFNGAWFFQLKKDRENNFCLLEIACRFAGSSVIHRLNGINFAYLNILNEKYNGNIQLLSNNINYTIDRSLNVKCKSNLYFESVYVDLDDTIIINNLVNTDILKFLYEMRNRNKNIYLLTKHKYSVDETLAKYTICKKLFTNIIQINNEDFKFKYIKDKNSIFIDDSFSERLSVFNNLNIPVFSVDSIITLL